MTDRCQDTFRVWAGACSHVGTDLRVAGRESLADALRQSEEGGREGGPAFDWDVMLNLGDFSGSQTTPDDEEGEEVVRQFSVLKKHRREDIYTLAGNHDATGPDEEPQWWFRKWIDPMGESTAFSGVDASHYPYRVEGTWERYSFRVGNLLFLMMSDRNDGGPPVGRSEKGGYPAGAVTEETFEWWKEQVESNTSSIIISAHHHMLKETTAGSGPWEGFRKNEKGNWCSDIHGYFADGGPEGASYLYFIGDKPGAGYFETYLEKNPGAIAFWLGAHTHLRPGTRINGRSHIETKWGVHFNNVAAFTRHHVSKYALPMSRLFNFKEGSDEVEVECYMHTSEMHPQGWLEPEKRTLKLDKPVKLHI